MCTQLINFFDTANPQDSILLQISKETINWVKEQLLMLFLKPTFSQSVYNGIVEVFGNFISGIFTLSLTFIYLFIYSLNLMFL